MSSPKTWSLVTTAPNRAEADILRGVLESAGIQVMLAGESYATTYGLPMPVEVLVPADQKADAEAILAASEFITDDETAADEGGDAAPS